MTTYRSLKSRILVLDFLPVKAMHTIESSTEKIFHNANSISGDTVKNLVQQAELWQKIVSVFKVT